jgi:hypothetical protein
MCDVLLPPGVNRMCEVVLPPGVNRMCDVLLPPGVNRMYDVLLPPGVNRMYDVLLPPGVNPLAVIYIVTFLGGRRGRPTPKYFVNITGERKKFKMLGFPLNQLQTCYGYLCDLLSFMSIDCIYFFRFKL